MVSKSLLNNPDEDAVYSTSNGVSFSKHPYGAERAGPTGPLLLQDFNLIDSLSHFDRERVPERVVHAKGGGAHGFFEVTDTLKDITFAHPFQKKGTSFPVSVRFSTVGGESGSADTIRDPRGFAIKLRTDEGIMDWVFNNTPVFFIRDPNKFPHFIHTQKRDPQTHLNQISDSTMTWDYFVQNPESIHQVAYLFGDRGVPASWRKMNGYSGHTFKMVNDKGDLTYVQIHAIADQEEKNFTQEKSVELAGSAPDYNSKDLFEAIEEGEFPSWTFYIQTMTPKQAEDFRYSILDLTKIWSHKDYPLRKFGKMVLNKNPENYFAEVEQIAFSPAHLVNGIYPSNDPVLQSRLYSYSDTHRHRIGPNYQQLPVNRSSTLVKGVGCPFLGGNFQRDGAMAYDNQGNRPNYLSTLRPIQSIAGKERDHKSYTGVVSQDLEKKQLELKEHDEKILTKSSFYISGISELDLEQPRALYQNVYNKEQKDRFVKNVVGHASSIRVQSIKENVALYFGLLEDDLGKSIASGLGVKYSTPTLQSYLEKIGPA